MLLNDEDLPEYRELPICTEAECCEPAGRWDNCSSRQPILKDPEKRENGGYGAIMSWPVIKD